MMAYRSAVHESMMAYRSAVHESMMAYRSAVHESTGQSPASLMFGRELHLTVNIMFERPEDGSLQESSYDDYTAQLQEYLARGGKRERTQQIHNLDELSKEADKVGRPKATKDAGIESPVLAGIKPGEEHPSEQ
ncbi:hypothetical protein AC249_AIPGENE26931 [Exaiptasia diaphana]|nr:hypothetical protein AC249_AIPGENE26931 [Exaiptasia diaphana]